MRIVLLGANGQLGKALTPVLEPLGELTLLNRQQIDFAQPHSLVEHLLPCRPNVIINAAAYTAVDKAEQDSSLAMAVNAIALEPLGAVAASLGALLVHYSTDYVFDGQKGAPYSEGDNPAPLNVYGLSKLLGERAIQASGCDYLILRTSWVYSADGSNFLRRILELANEREELRIVNDQQGCPTSAPDLAAATAELLQQTWADKQSAGFQSQLYHLCGPGHTTWYEFAQHIVVEAQSCGLLDRPPRLVPVTSDEYPQPARRPRNSVLDTHKIQQRGIHLPDWRDSSSELVYRLTRLHQIDTAE